MTRRVLAAGPSSGRRHRTWGRRALPPGRLAGAIACAAAIAAAIVAVSAGGGNPVVAQAYAATSPAGVIVHYVQTQQIIGPGSATQRTVVQVWSHGPQTHLIINPGSGQPSLELAIDGTVARSYSAGREGSYRVPAASAGCRGSAVLVFVCLDGSESTPIEAVRALMKTGVIHAAGQTLLAGRRVDLLEGQTGTVTVRAFVDPHTFAPIEIQSSGPVNPTRPSSGRATMTITGYQRLVLSAHNERLLQMRRHPAASVTRH